MSRFKTYRRVEKNTIGNQSAKSDDFIECIKDRRYMVNFATSKFVNKSKKLIYSLTYVYVYVIMYVNL